MNGDERGENGIQANDQQAVETNMNADCWDAEQWAEDENQGIVIRE